MERGRGRRFGQKEKEWLPNKATGEVTLQEDQVYQTQFPWYTQGHLSETVFILSHSNKVMLAGSLSPGYTAMFLQLVWPRGGEYGVLGVLSLPVSCDHPRKGLLEGRALY